jgi:hypothetical protein
VLVLDNLREGVLAPDIYDPTLNPLYHSSYIVLVHRRGQPAGVRAEDALFGARARAVSGAVYPREEQPKRTCATRSERNGPDLAKPDEREAEAAYDRSRTLPRLTSPHHTCRTTTRGKE